MITKLTITQPAPGVLIRSDGLVQAHRFYKSEGATFSGWVVSEYHRPRETDGPFWTKADAIDAMLAWRVER